MWKRGEIAPKEQFLLFSTLIYIYISNFRSQITYPFVKYGYSIYCFPHSLNSVEVRISRSVSVIPLEFEISRVDCISKIVLLDIRKSHLLCRDDHLRTFNFVGNFDAKIKMFTNTVEVDTLILERLLKWQQATFSFF